MRGKAGDAMGRFWEAPRFEKELDRDHALYYLDTALELWRG